MKTSVKIASILTLLIAVLTLSCLLSPAYAAGETITKTVNIAAANKNESGPGYNWANRYDVLTLSGLRIETDDPYGLRLPKNCKVILEGDNYIKASKYGISLSGTVDFKGSGTLTVEAGEIGFYLISQDKTQKIRLIEGSYTITAGKWGIYSDAADFSFIGDSMTVNMTDPSAPAIAGRCVNLLGGTFTSNAPVEASQALLVNGVTLDIAANSPALSAKNLEIKNIELSNGGDYNGENAISAKGLAKFHATSVLLGESVPGWVDYLLLLAALAVVAALIVFPSLRKKKKKKELYERLAKEGYHVPEA